jgi:hypothetical protein
LNRDPGRRTISASMSRPATYEEFWPYYVSQHAAASTRALHFAGTLTMLGTLAAAALVDARWLLAAPVAGYAPAWIGHFFFERNRPATFTYPLWSLRADLRMFLLMLTGRMGPEVERARALHPKG